jgi:protein phosphatase
MMGPSPLGMTGQHRLSGAIACGISDIGPVRKSNEDNFLIDAELDLLAIADGMGGHQAGAVASAGALEALRQFLAASKGNGAGGETDASTDPDATWSDPAMRAIGLLHDAVDFANTRLYAQNQERQLRDGSGMGTTLTGFWRPQPAGPLLLFHVGDSRLYRYRADELDLLTHDQTWYQQALDAGKLDDLPPRNLLLQAIGPSSLVKPEIRSQMVLPGDLLMLCSDGLHGCVPHREMAEVLAAATVNGLPEACRRLVALANDYDGRDNVTVLLVMCCE